MKELLTTIENYLKSLIEDNSQRLLGSSRLENKLVNQLVQTMGDQIRIDSQGNLTAPHIFALSVPADYAEDIRTNQYLLDNLASNLMHAGLSEGVHFNGTITITIFPDSNLKEGEFLVRAIWKQENLNETQLYQSTTSGIQATLQTPKAFIVVGGTHIFTIDEDIINIGRQSNNDLILEDPRVSRKHAQIRVLKGRHMLFDLGSSGGTFVNNQRINQVTLHPGDVLSLAGVPLVYGQDAQIQIDETKEYIPPSNIESGGTTSTTFNPDSHNE